MGAFWGKVHMVFNIREKIYYISGDDCSHYYSSGEKKGIFETVERVLWNTFLDEL